MALCGKVVALNGQMAKVTLEQRADERPNSTGLEI